MCHELETERERERDLTYHRGAFAPLVPAGASELLELVGTQAADMAGNHSNSVSLHSNLPKLLPKESAIYGS